MGAPTGTSQSQDSTAPPCDAPNMRPLIALLLLLTLSACGGSASDDTAAPAPTPSAPATTEAPTPSPTTDPQAELKAAVQAYSDAFLTGNGAGAYALLSARCQARETEAEFTAIVDQAGDLYGSALPFESFDAEVSGDMARVTYTYSIAAINQDAEPWVREGGVRLEDDC